MMNHAHGLRRRLTRVVHICGHVRFTYIVDYSNFDILENKLYLLLGNFKTKWNIMLQLEIRNFENDEL